MKYFVTGIDRVKYGPFEIRELNRLAFENRISKESQIFEEETGKEVNINDIVTFLPPVEDRLSAYSHAMDKNRTYDIYKIISIWCVFIFPFAGIIFSVMALKISKTIGVNKTTSVVILIINIIMSVLWIGVIGIYLYLLIKYPVGPDGTMLPPSPARPGQFYFN